MVSFSRQPLKIKPLAAHALRAAPESLCATSLRRLVKAKMVNGSAPDLFPAACMLKKPFLPPTIGSLTLLAWPAGRVLQPFENEKIFMVKKMAIKWNLMPEFFHLLGRAKVR